MVKEFQPLLSPPPISTDEWHHVFLITIPLVLLQILEYLPLPILNMYLGHLGSSTPSTLMAGQHTCIASHTRPVDLDQSESRVVLAAGGLSSLFFTTTAYSVVIGVSTAMDALTAQAHGKGRGLELGIVLQTAALCAGVLCVPLALVTFFSGSILVALGQPVDVLYYLLL
ncbi:hypothetical protein AaE_005390 [Aphanomyces astaci]|uniref:Uncharacterized protein n=1 Tax=Aphanomyces astaci TaxID=112090 RepID=A0A6A5AMK5_APHAT|nr:hypothetical protein AaE_005390 [Aphanomyces astaci]